MEDKTIDLAKKLHALAEKGVGGEKENAQEMLTRLLKKHGLTLADIIGEKKSTRKFLAKNDLQRKLIRQVIYSVIRQPNAWEYKANKYVFAELTDAEFLEIHEKINFYWAEYQRDLEIFYSAFIQKNKLFRKPPGDGEEDTELSPKQKKQAEEVMRMMKGMNEKTFLKTLKQ